MRTSLRRELHLAVRVGEVAARCDGPGELVPERVGRSGHGRESERLPRGPSLLFVAGAGRGPPGAGPQGNSFRVHYATHQGEARSTGRRMLVPRQVVPDT